MVEVNILHKEPITIRELRDELKRIKERDKELSLRGSRCEEYTNTFATIGKTKEKELLEKIKGFNIPMMKDSHIKKIIDIMPTSEKHLRVIVSGFSFQIKNEDIKKIFNAVKEYS